MWLPALFVLLASVVAHGLPADEYSFGRIAVDAESCRSVKKYFASRNLSSTIPNSPVSSVSPASTHPNGEGAGLKVCGANRSCCTPDMEAELLQQVHHDFSLLVHRNSQPMQDLLVSSAEAIRGHLVQLARWSEDKTLSLFGQVYQRMAVLARAPIRQLYADVARYLDAPSATSGPDLPGLADPVWLSAPPQGVHMAESVDRFFARLFPLTFHFTVAPIKGIGDPSRPPQQLNSTYERCLSSKMAEVQPFGDAPRVMAHNLGRALEAARVLLGVLQIAANVLNASDVMMMDGDPRAEAMCPALLLRMWACPRCAGLGEELRPCQPLCVNVLRACLEDRAHDLGEPWFSFMDAAEKLAGAAAAAPAFPGRPQSPARAAPYQLNAEEAIRQMENKISEAIMFAMEHGPGVEKKMKSACGPPVWVDAKPTPSPAPSSPTPSASSQLLASRRFALDDALGSAMNHDRMPEAAEAGSPASAESAASFRYTLFKLQESLRKSRSFYRNMASTLCEDEAFARAHTEPCWNGQRIGEYDKPIAAPGTQRYNPEVAHGAEPALPAPPGLAQLCDQLRHLRKLVMGQLAELSLAPESHSFVRDRDADGDAGVEGSGGAPGSAWSDDEDHAGWAEGDGEGSGRGSGEEPIPNESSPVWPTKQPVHTEPNVGPGTDKTSGASSFRDSAVLVLCFLAVLRLAVQ